MRNTVAITLSGVSVLAVAGALTLLLHVGTAPDHQASTQVAAAQPSLSVPHGVGRTTWPTALPSEPAPVSAPAGGCGPWSNPASPQATAVLAHGTITSCQLIGSTWIVTTQHSSGPGEVGALTCSQIDTQCLNGWPTHDLTDFSWSTAPAGSYLKSVQVQSGRITFTDGPGLVTFNIAESRFTS